jgi:hypothetical protein
MKIVSSIVTTKLKGTILFQRFSANSLDLSQNDNLCVLERSKKVKEQERWEVYDFVEREVGREK